MTTLLILLNGQEQLELTGQFVLRVQAVTKVDSSNATVGMDLHLQCLEVVRSVGSSREIRQIELNLIPALVQTHGHRTNERLDPSGRLVVTGPESSLNVLVVQYLYFEREIFFKLLID